MEHVMGANNQWLATYLQEFAASNCRAYGCTGMVSHRCNRGSLTGDTHPQPQSAA